MNEKGRRMKAVGLMVVLVAAAVYAVLFTVMQLRIFEGLNLGIWDLAYFDQALYNSLHGCLLCTSGRGAVESLFVEHAYLIMLGLLPIYALIPRTELLFALQALIIASGSIPLYLIARRYLTREPLAVVLALSYLLYPPLQWANLNGIQYAFHPETLFPAFFLFAFYFLMMDRRALAALFFALTVSVEEHQALAVAAVGLFLVLTDRSRRRFGLFLSALSVIWLALAVTFVIPGFRGEPPFYVQWMQAAPATGPNWQAVLPQVGPLLINYIWGLLAPLLFLSLGEPLLIGAVIPNLTLNFLALLADYDEPSKINLSYHVSSLVPIVFVSAVFGVRRLTAWLEKRQARFPVPSVLAAGLLIAAVTGNYLYGPLPWTRTGDPSHFDTLPEPRARSLQDLEKLISPTESLSAEYFVGSHFTQRLEIYRFPINWQKVDAVLIDFPRLRPNALRAYEQLRACPDFAPVYNDNGFELYKRVTWDVSRYRTVVGANFGNTIRLDGFRTPSASVRPGAAFTLDLGWTALKKPPVSYTVFVHLVDREGQRLAQADGLPAHGTYPTTAWKAGSPVYDRHEVTVPGSLVPGSYTVQVGLYDLNTGERLPVLDEVGNPRDSKVDLVQVEVTGR